MKSLTLGLALFAVTFTTSLEAQARHNDPANEWKWKAAGHGLELLADAASTVVGVTYGGGLGFSYALKSAGDLYFDFKNIKSVIETGHSTEYKGVVDYGIAKLARASGASERVTRGLRNTGEIADGIASFLIPVALTLNGVRGPRILRRAWGYPEQGRVVEIAGRDYPAAVYLRADKADTLTGGLGLGTSVLHGVIGFHKAGLSPGF